MIERYTREEMGRIWTLENKFQKWLEIEIAACEAWAELGVIPWDAVEKIAQNAKFTVDRILEIEKETRHDVIAFTRCVAESLGEESKYVHYGLTSSDVVDTATALLMVEAGDLIIKELKENLDILKEGANQYKYTIMMGRTHGVHAEPTTLGLKFALWYSEMERNLERFHQAVEGIRYGKLSGAVGTFGNIDPRVEEYVCRKLGLNPAPISTQILQRDRHAHYLTTLGILAGTIEKIALEIRGLQKTETREVEEPFYSGQKGSSAMPHKRNPVNCEQLCGLARVVRSNSLIAMENQALWHERDISHSSAERVIIPDSTILIHYMLYKLKGILRDLHVYPENMLENIKKSYNLTFSGRALLYLVQGGLKREEAYDLIQKHAMTAWQEKRDFKELLLEDPLIREKIAPELIEEIFDLNFCTKQVDYIFNRLGI
ncbi:adenylosuccinate lyase [Anaerobranca gottschalkii]|uniref:Adenylosuccinate lyase n=1 Tax=Anaerobranca gottschalkii DSM 13577 TaxID=1120990 RepID=A0A1I0AS22_9FIRM|nr:adenylosuccinate lyase [Anaerobranca gottschalkii]SES96339.1 adenylosuccinate lyase [Anaerobranca gottschalkii DSM 13577]